MNSLRTKLVAATMFGAAGLTLGACEMARNAFDTVHSKSMQGFDQGIDRNGKMILCDRNTGACHNEGNVPRLNNNRVVCDYVVVEPSRDVNRAGGGNVRLRGTVEQRCYNIR